MPPKKQKKLRKPRANKRSGKPQPLPRSVQALLQYLGGSDVKLGSSRPQRAQVAQQPQPQQLQQQQIQYAAAISGAPPQAAAAISGAAPKAAARPRGRPKGTGNAKAVATLVPAVPKAPARPRGRPKKIGDVIAPSPLALAGLALQPQQVIMQQSAQQQQDTKKMEESQKQIQTDIAAMKIKQENHNKTQTPVETLAFFQQKPNFPSFMGRFPTRSEFSAAEKKPSLVGSLPDNAFFGSVPASQRSMSSQQSLLQSLFKERDPSISSSRYEGMMQVRAPSSYSQASSPFSVITPEPDQSAPAASSVGEHLAQQFIQNVASPEKLPTKKLRVRQPKVAAAAVPMKFEGQTAEQAISTFQAAKPARKHRAKASAVVVLPVGVDPSTQVQMLAAGGAAAAAPKQRRGRSLKELSKGAGAKSE